MDEPTATPTSPDAPAREGSGSDAPSRHSRLGVAVVVVCALAALFWPREERINLQVFRRQLEKGVAAPVGMLIDSGGRPVPLATRMAPVTLVHFWATWCAPCLDEVPSILRLADHYGVDHNFALVMIAVEEETKNARVFLGDRVSEALFDHDWKVTHGYGTEKVPETHLVVKGKIVESFIGATNWDDPEIRRRLDEALASLAG